MNGEFRFNFALFASTRPIVRWAAGPPQRVPHRWQLRPAVTIHYVGRGAGGRPAHSGGWMNLAGHLITPRDIAAFQADGAIVVRGLLSLEEIELLRAGIDANLAHPSPRAKVASARDDPGFFLEDFCCWQENERYRRVIFGSALGEAGALLMQSRTARLYHDHMLTKEPGTRQRTPWHQDQPYYNIEGRQNCSFWIPVDPVARESTLEFVAGSHLGPWLMPRSFLASEAKWFPEGSLADLPDIEADRSRHRILGWALEPGDAVCFHMLALHATAGVAAGQRRRVFSVRLLGDDIRHAPRRWKTSPDFAGLEAELLAGAPMEHALFPLLWSRGAPHAA